MTNDSFFEKICEFIKEKNQKYETSKSKQDKFEFPSDFFEHFTIDQLNIIRNTLRK